MSTPTLPFVPGPVYVPVNVKAGSLNVVNQIGQRSTGSISVWTARGVLVTDEVDGDEDDAKDHEHAEATVYAG